MWLGAVLAGLLVAGLSACSMSEPTLYQRLGGSPGIAAVTDDFVDNVRADPAVSQRFAGTDPAQTKRRLTELFCQASGGPCKYTGRGTVPLSDAEFNAMTADMTKTLDKFKLPPRERSEMLKLMASVRRDLAAA
ncbi:MAG TPA: group 1 truncated hemoglobin [Alphaproteobacteria bacterium]